MLKNLETVSEEVLELFADTSKRLQEKFKGDKEKAIRACLAYMSGYYQMSLVARSLLTGQERMATMTLTVPREPRFSSIMDRAWSVLRQYFPPKLTDIIKIIKAKKDGSGVVFDIYEDKVEQFTDYLNDAKERFPDAQIECARCTALPELEEDDEDYSSGGQGGGWGRGGSSYGGGGY
jgi:uncharacterized membrane protein YgcG